MLARRGKARRTEYPLGALRWYAFEAQTIAPRFACVLEDAHENQRDSRRTLHVRSTCRRLMDFAPRIQGTSFEKKSTAFEKLGFTSVLFTYRPAATLRDRVERSLSDVRGQRGDRRTGTWSTRIFSSTWGVAVGTPSGLVSSRMVRDADHDELFAAIREEDSPYWPCSATRDGKLPLARQLQGRHIHLSRHVGSVRVPLFFHLLALSQPCRNRASSECTGRSRYGSLSFGWQIS